MTLVRLWARPFRPEDEMAADADAVRWTHEAGYDPREMLDVLEAIGRQRKAPPIPLPDFLCSHPAPDARGKAVMALYAELTQGRDEEELYLGKENLRRRIPRSRHEFPE